MSMNVMNSKGLILIPSFGLIFSSYLNTAIAVEEDCSSNMFFSQDYSQEKQTSLTDKQNKKKEQRRRGDCNTLPHLWTVSLCQAGSFCYIATKPVQIWLPQHQRSGRMNDRVIIKHLDSKTMTVKSWASTNAIMAWPLKQIPLQSETVYLIGIKKRGEYTLNKMVFYQIPAHWTKAEQAAEMRKKGCIQQAELLEKQESL